MKNIKSKRIRIVLFSGAVLILGVIMLVSAILIAEKIEEGKIIETAYASDKTETAGTVDTDVSGYTAESKDDVTEEELLEASDVPDTVYVPETIERVERGPQDITADEAKHIMNTQTELLFDETIDCATFSAVFDRNGQGITHDTWSIYNTDFSCILDAVTGNVIYIDEIRDYTGKDDFSKSDVEFWEAADEIICNPLIYEDLAADFVNSRLADGRTIEYLMVDGMQAVFNDDNQEQTVVVDVHVLMNGGRSYTLSFIGSERYLYRFMAHPSQEGAFYGFLWEDEASEYPSDWRSDVRVPA